jgi:hypothetical protein
MIRLRLENTPRVAKFTEPRGNLQLTSQEIERRLCKLKWKNGKKYKGKTYATAGWLIRLNNRERNPNIKAKDWGPTLGDNHLLIMAMYRKGLGCKTIANSLNLTHQPLKRMLHSVGLITKSSIERNQRIYENKAGKGSMELRLAYFSEQKLIKATIKDYDLSYLYYYWPDFNEMIKRRYALRNYYGNLDKRREAAKHYAKKRYRKNKAAMNNAHIASIIRTRLYNVLRGNTKSAPTLRLLGCSLSHAIAHIEQKFANGMSWDNHGKWHIDHIKPCASFDLSRPQEQAKCFHYTNLQPMWAADNISKGSRYGRRLYRYKQPNPTPTKKAII